MHLSVHVTEPDQSEFCIPVSSDWLRARELGQLEPSQDFAGLLKKEALRKSQW